MDVHLMGKVEIHGGSGPISLSRAGERCVLASLALEPGRRIHVDTLIDRLWGDDPPASAIHTIASYIRTVRKAIEDAGGRREWLKNYRPVTYELGIDPGLVDYHRFTSLVGQAGTKQREGLPTDAVALYQQALELRTAEALADVTGQWAADCRYAIERRYLDALCALYEQQLTIGEYTAVASHATNLVMEVIPTDRMIALALYGLAGSGQHAAISDFLRRATQRMWDAVQARPGRQVADLARRLIANPDARLPRHTPPVDLQQNAPNKRAVRDADSGSVPSGDGEEPGRRSTVRDGLITMSAEHNTQVYQAAGDQYVTGTA